MSCRLCYYFESPRDAFGFRDYDGEQPGRCLRYPTAVKKSGGEVCGEYRFTSMLDIYGEPIQEHWIKDREETAAALYRYRDRALKAEKKLKELRAKQRAEKTKP